MRLPQDLRDLIIDYKNGIEHYERFQPCLDGVVMMYHTMKRMRLNLEFEMAFFPDWSSYLVPFPFPHLVFPFEFTEVEEPDP